MTAKRSVRLGAKVRALRRAHDLRQTQLAEVLGISPSYLNLIEHDRRPLPAELLLKLAQQFELDLKSFAEEGDGRLGADLMEVFGDPVLEHHGLSTAEVRELTVAAPGVARAVVQLYQLYRGARESAEGMAARLSTDAGSDTLAVSRLPSEEVSDFLSAKRNHFPGLERAANELWREVDLRPDDMYHGLSRHLRERHGVHIRYVAAAADGGAVRRFDRSRRVLVLSEGLSRSSRKFQIALQIGLLQHRDLLDRLAEEAGLSSEGSVALCRLALASYYAGAVVMPYEAVIGAARETRYDLDLLQNRFGVGFEQVCHRLTTLARTGDEGIPFHFVRCDIAGNISKRFSGTGIAIPRFGGACPRWNLYKAFLTPGEINAEVAVMPDGTKYFCIARTVTGEARGYHAPKKVQAITLGCEAGDARAMVYSDGMDLDNLDAAVPIGTTCRLCERMDCEQRAFPPLQHPLHVDENLRGISFYTPVRP